MVDKEFNLIENIKKYKIKMSEFINKINYENDINLFIKSKITKFSQPKPFEFVDYNPDIILRNRKGYSETSQHEISLKILENQEIFKFEKNSSNKEEENNNFVNECVNDIWDWNEFNKKNWILYLKSIHIKLDF